MISGIVDDSRVIARFSRMGQEAAQRVARALDKSGTDLVTHIVQDELSGQILSRRSGDLSRAVTHTAPKIEGNTISTQVGVFSGVPYARPLEYGATIPEVTGPLMVFTATNGAVVFTRHRRSFQLKEYRYLRQGLADQRASILADITRAVTSE